jgi:hypothetical protein
MVYLLGIDHHLQWNREHPLTAKLIEYLDQKISEHNITVCGEEFFEEILTSDPFYYKKNILTTTVKDLALERKIKHIYCDPNFNDRAQIGIRSHGILRKIVGIPSYKLEKDFTKEEHEKLTKESTKDNDAREAYWFNKICGYLDEELVFVCGSQHIKTFSDLLKSKGNNVIVFPERFDNPEL